MAEPVGCIGGIVIDCLNPLALAEFWAAVLGVAPDLSDPEWPEVPSPATGRLLSFQGVAEPKQVKNRVHLDVDVLDLPPAVAACASLGARVVGPVREDRYGRFQVMADPESHEFCLVVPRGPAGRRPGGTPSGGAAPPYVLEPIGVVESTLVDPETAPKQGAEGAPEAWLVFAPHVRVGLADLRVRTEVIVLTWLDRARRDVLAVHPRDDPDNPVTGVFTTRSADRPNPIGLHRVEIVAIESHKVRVRNLEALDGTPILDVKPLLYSDPDPQAA